MINTCIHFRLCTSLMPAEGAGPKEEEEMMGWEREEEEEERGRDRKGGKERNTKRQTESHTRMGEANPS